MSTTPDPTDRALDAAADAGFQARGTRFASLDELVTFARRGGVLTSYECATLAEAYHRVARERPRL